MWLHSTPVKLTDGIADNNGTFTRTLTIPAETELGAHRIEVRGSTSGSVFAGLNVSDIRLAATGASDVSIPLLIGSALAVLVGASALLISRRRQAMD